MRLGVVLISSGFAGAERVVYRLVKELCKRREDEIFLILNNEIFEYYKDLEKINIHRIGIMDKGNPILNLINFYRMQKKIKHIIKENKIEIINSHMDLSNFVSPKKINNINTFHGTDLIYLINPPSLKYRFVILPKIKKNLNNSFRIISVGKEQVQKLPEKYKKKTAIISNGVDSKIFKPLNNIKQKKKVILFAGRFIDIKGIKEIINVAKKSPQYEFWFAGQGPLANLINLPNTKNLGFKSTEELVKLYNQATICIQPSYREGFPLCGLEAMACGRAIIATPLGFSEYIENGKDGIIIPAKDETALKNAIVDLMKNEKKRKMIEKNARKKALKYSWDKISKRYINVFKEVLDNAKKK